MGLDIGHSSIAEMSSADVMDLLRLGVDTRNQGKLLEAETVLLFTHRMFPSHWQPLYELGVLYSTKEELDKAFMCYLESFELNRSSAPLLERLLGIVCSKGLDEKLVEIISKVDNCNYQFTWLAECSVQLLKFIREFSIPEIEKLYKDMFEDRGAFQSASQVVQELYRAVDANVGYAIVRISDGEGSWLQHDLVEEIRYGALYKRNREEFWYDWFGKGQRSKIPDFYKFTRQLVDELKHVDMIGVSPLSWVKHEYKHGNLRGCPSTLNSVRIVLKNTSKNSKVCSCMIHYDLGNSQEFMDFLGKAKEIGVISCQPDLKDYLETILPDTLLTFIGIPSEPSRRHLLGEKAITGDHFPDGFNDALAKIRSRNWNKVPFLIAGGVLAKFYAIEIKKRGGIAIDIGSQADKWMKRKTRPNF
ncbi:tetratricopeptide repeat protein [Pseudomonas oryzihabitans]|uniref:tetratricopeptide repeat protein n=1 Tax=Pseudomonas oryzihabitans TaxID=47885 RepID=UPI002420226A|nr:hypothetical protein [Pseudomonas oryzihabitans]